MGNKCPCVSSGGQTKNSNDEYVVNEETSSKKNKKQEKNNKKTAAKYSVPSAGLDNTGFDDTGGGRNEASGFTNIANIAPNGDGPKIYRNGSSESQEEIHIEYGTDTSERAVDVPGVKYVNRSPLSDPNHNSKVSNSGNGGIYEGDDGEIIDTRLRLPSADLDLDNEGKVKQKAQQHINPAFDDTESLRSVEEKPDNTKDSNSKYRENDTNSLSSKSSSNSAKVFGGTGNAGVGKESVNADDIDFDMDINIGNNSDQEIQHTKHKTFEANFDLASDNKPQIDSTDHTTHEALMKLKLDGDNHNKLILEGATDMDENESSDFDVIESKKTISRSSSSSSSSSSNSEDGGPIKHAKFKTHETHFNLENNEITTQTESQIVIENSNEHKGLVMTDMQLFEDKTDDEPVIVKLGKDNYNSLLKENNPKDDESDEDKDIDDKSDKGEARKIGDDLDSNGKPWFLQGSKGREENLEVEEITLLIEKLEDSLVSDMTGHLDAEVLSRNIVEKLDEISALREQAELEIPVDVVIQQMEDYDDSDEEDEEYETEQDIIDWYNKRMDELNEAVGMDLLEMSIAESLDDDTIRPLFKQHSETQSYFIKKRIVELEKLRKKKLVTNQKGMFEPRSESPIELQRPTRMKLSDMQNDENDQELTVDDLKDLKTDELDTNDLNSGSYVSATEYRSNSPSDIPEITKDAIIEFEKPIETLSDNNTEHLNEKPADIPVQFLQNDDVNIVVSDKDETTIETTVLKNDSLHERKLDDIEKLKSEPNIFEETEISFGVNQFVSPSKSEEDLWRGVERLPSEEIISNDETKQQFDILESNNLVFSVEDNIQQNTAVDNTNVDIVTETDKPVTKAQVYLMYDTDSDSSDQNSVSEDEIVANSEHRKQVSTDHQIFHITQSTANNTSFENNDDIEKTGENDHLSLNQTTRASPTMQCDNSEGILLETPVILESEVTESNVQDRSEDNMSYHMEQEVNKPFAKLEFQVKKEAAKSSAMYGSSDSSSDESESEELIRKAFELEKQQQNVANEREEHENKEHAVVVNESVIVSEKSGKRSINVDMDFKSDSDEGLSSPVHNNNGAHISEQFNTDKIEYLDQSQNQANDLLAEIHAISESKSQSENHSDIELVISDNEYIPDTSDTVNNENDFGAVVYNPPTEQNESESQEDIVDNMLLQLSMQPIPPLEIEEDNVIQTKTVKVSSKETGEIYPENSHITKNIESDLINNHPILERKHTEEIAVDDSTDTDDTEGLIEAAMEQEKKSQSSHGDSSSEDDPDTEDIIVKYDEAMKLKPARPVYDISDSDSSTLDENSDEDNDEGDFEAKVELRETLKDDIRCSLHQMTQDDFQNLMGMYRKERSSLRNTRDQERARVNESLWEKLQRRKDAVDQYIHDGDDTHESRSLSNGTSVGTQVQPSSQTTGVGSSSASQANKMVGEDESDTSETSQEHEEDEIVEESLMESEELSQTIQLMDLEIVQNAAECENNDELNALLQEHFELTEKMRRNKEATLAMHRNKAKQKLMERKNRQFSDSSSEDSCNEENTTNKDQFIDKEMDNLRETYLDAVKTRNEISEQDLHDIIVQYREDQQELIRKREYEKLRINEKLRERLKDKKDVYEHEPTDITNAIQSPKDETNELSQLDAEFYKNLYKRHAAGELDEEEMGLLIEEHLDQVEEFKKNIQKEMRKRRKARKQMTDTMKFKAAELMIDAEKEEAERIRNIRETEKQNVNAKLQERLHKKDKQYVDTPELPPPKLPSKSKREIRKQQQQIQDYENVEYEC